MFDSLKEIRLRTIALVAVAVWAILAALWFLTLGWNHTIPAPAAKTVQGTPTQLKAAPLPDSGSPPGGNADSMQTSPEIVIQGGSSKAEPKESAETPNPRSKAIKSGELVLQLGAFKGEPGAEKRASEIRSKGIPCQVRTPESASDYFRVLAGPYLSKSDALSDQVRLKEEGIDSFLRKAY